MLQLNHLWNGHFSNHAQLNWHFWGKGGYVWFKNKTSITAFVILISLGNQHYEMLPVGNSYFPALGNIWNLGRVLLLESFVKEVFLRCFIKIPKYHRNQTLSESLHVDAKISQLIVVYEPFLLSYNSRLILSFSGRHRRPGCSCMQPPNSPETSLQIVSSFPSQVHFSHIVSSWLAYSFQRTPYCTALLSLGGGQEAPPWAPQLLYHPAFLLTLTSASMAWVWVFFLPRN